MGNDFEKDWDNVGKMQKVIFVIAFLFVALLMIFLVLALIWFGKVVL